MEPFIGQIILFGGNFAPRGWAFCDGQLLPIASNTALFSILGTIYGGDGRTTFALPDLRGRFPLSPGSGPGLPHGNQGERGGYYEAHLTQANLPAHSHTATLHAGKIQATSKNPSGAVFGGSTENMYEPPQTSTNTVAMASQSITVANTGGNQPVPIENPFLAIPYIIALVGIFPSRS